MVAPLKRQSLVRSRRFEDIPGFYPGTRCAPASDLIARLLICEGQSGNKGFLKTYNGLREAPQRRLSVRHPLLVFVPVALVAQVVTPAAFDVASVRASKMLTARSQTADPGGIAYANVTLSDCIEAAWDVKPYQISGPEWLQSDRFDISARVEGPASKDRLMLMLQTLLSDRFKLRLHRETMERSVYVLVTAKSGPRLHAAQDESETGSAFVEGGLAFKNVSMRAFADYLGGWSAIDRPVRDRTGLMGGFDFTLRLFEDRPGMTGFDRKFAMRDAEHIFTDLQE
jgi:uncharacterized protein (TIGR03435 family)